MPGRFTKACLVAAMLFGGLAAEAQTPGACPAAYALDKVKSAKDLSALDARKADAIFDCMQLAPQERAALAVYRAKAKPLGPSKGFDDWFLSADVLDTFTLFNGADSFFTDQSADVKAGWDTLKVKLTNLFSDRRRAFDYVDASKAALTLHWTTFTSEMTAADKFLDLENSTYTANLKPTAESGFALTLSKALAAGAKLPGPQAVALKAFGGVVDLIELISKINDTPTIAPTGRIDDSRTGRDTLSITMANLQLNYQAEYADRLEALDRLKTYAVRDKALMDQLAALQGDVITGMNPAAILGANSKIAIRHHLVETLLPIRGVIYGTDITRNMASLFVQEPWGILDSDQARLRTDQNYLTYRLAPYFPVGKAWTEGYQVVDRKDLCPASATQRSKEFKAFNISASLSYTDQPCNTVLAYSGFRVNTTFGSGDGIPEGEFQEWRLAFGGGGKGEIPRLATEGMSKVPGFDSPWSWIRSVMSPKEVFDLLRDEEGRLIIQQVRYNCLPNPRTVWVCLSEGVSPSVRDTEPTGYDPVPLPVWPLSSNMFWMEKPEVRLMPTVGAVTNSMGYWPPADATKRFSFIMYRYMPGQTTQEVCYGENGQGRNCKTWDKGAIVPTTWVVPNDEPAIPPPPPEPPPPLYLDEGAITNAAGQCLQIELYARAGQRGAGRFVSTSATCDGRAAQRWWMDFASDSQIWTFADGQRWCLDADLSNPFATGPREVLAWTCKSDVEQSISKNQRWTAGNDGSVNVTAGFPQVTMVLSGQGAGSGLVADPWNGRTPTQRWKLTSGVKR